jgi:hypothetical protein
MEEVSAPSVPDKDGLTIMAVTSLVARKDGGTCKSLST